ncbi:MAG: TonB-dependent hemoglobin/transferrin/lactoferrin family receptor [Halieaceae bacterium]|jgi:hemoglobin/transferrin/lactoferrin receptor protein|nr:TonB-dependent hemoglobin/transferrin/lactoferrin family receptor [Halieaceae bacterium]
MSTTTKPAAPVDPIKKASTFKQRTLLPLAAAVLGASLSAAALAQGGDARTIKGRDSAASAQAEREQAAGASTSTRAHNAEAGRRSAGAGQGLQLESVTVVGTRTERTLGEVEATISVYDQEDIERRLVRDIQDLVRYEPGVSVGGTGSRFGLEGFTIRGVGGNRVLTMVDGIRQPEEFSFGPFLSSRRDLVDVDQISRIEIARGPVSTLYGSDALGGVVAITTRAPNEYVDAMDSTHLDLKTGYSSADDSFIGTVNGAYGTEKLAGLVTYTYRQSSETETAGSVGGTGPARTEADPQSIDTQTLNFKLGWSPVDGHNFIATVEDFDSQVDTTLLSDAGEFARGTLTESRVAFDERSRQRYSLAYRYDGGGLIDNAFATAYYQTSETTQLTLDEQRVGGAARLRARDSLFEQEVTGLFAQASSLLTFANMEHTLTYGVDYYRMDNANIRTGETTDAATGAPVREFFPFPTRDFPPTVVENRAFFLQDEIVMLDGRLRITPGLRYDDYEADTTADELYINGNPGTEAPADFADSALTLKLGGLYQFTDGISAWARYSEGFRAPPYDDVNVGFTNFIGGYKSIAAPNLDAETSTGYELGLRLNGATGNLQLAVFDTLYDNFIQARAPAPAFAATGGVDPRDGLVTFQSVNLDEVEIRGVELRGALDLGSLVSSLDTLYLEGAFAFAEGEDNAGVPVETIDPMNAVLGLRWAPTALPIESELIWTWVDRKDPEDIVTERPATDSYSLIDLLVHYDLSDTWTVDAGVFNLFDESYIRWADTAGIGADASGRFTQPGRNFAITLRAAL